MIRNMLQKKLLAFFLSIILLGFLVGYTFSIFTNGRPKDSHVNTTDTVIHNKDVGD